MRRWVANLCTAILFAAGVCVMPIAAMAASAHIAVAANFTDAATEIAAAFTETTGHQAILSYGATGQFYAQIAQGAPFDILLAADAERPARLVDAGNGVPGTAFTYAIGQLVLYSTDPTLVNGSDTLLVHGANTLEGTGFRKLAMANPDTAPYGRAAVQVMDALGVFAQLKPKIVQGQNIGQAYQFVHTGNAELGFVAAGQVAHRNDGSRWVVPQELYDPIRQDAVLLARGQNNPAATAFLDFLKGDVAGDIIRKYGYAHPE